MVDAQRAVDLTIGLLSYEGAGVDRTVDGWQGLSGITYVDVSGSEQHVKRYDIYGGYVGDRARKASIIVQPSTRTTAYAEDQQLPVKVDDAFVIAINVVSRSFAKNQQDQLIAVCDNIQDLIETRPDFVLGVWTEMLVDQVDENVRIPGKGEVWRNDDGSYWMVADDICEEPSVNPGNNQGLIQLSGPPRPLCKPFALTDFPDQLDATNAALLTGENYIRVSSVDYNDEIQFGVRRAEQVATIYAMVTANAHVQW